MPQELLPWLACLAAPGSEEAEMEQDLKGLQATVAELSATATTERKLLEARLSELEKRLGALEQAGEAQQEASCKQLRSRSSLGDEIMEYSMGATLWDTPAFVGLPELGPGASAGLALNTGLNALVQIYVVFFLISSHEFITPDSWMAAYEAASRWRLNEAHEFGKVVNDGTSLAARVCGQDAALSVASQQLSLVEEINSYLMLQPEAFQAFRFGRSQMLCAVCMFLFAAVIFKDLRSLVTSAVAFASVPRGRTKLEGNVLAAVSLPRLLFFLAGCLVRATVAVALLYTGLMWLAYTSSTSDLILNAAALGFVMDLDEILFEATVPAKAHRFIGALAPLRYRRSRLHCEAWAPLVLMLGLVWACIVGVVMPNSDDMLRVKEALCGGQLDFAVQQNAAGYVVSRLTTPFRAAGEGAHMTASRRKAVSGSAGAVDVFGIKGYAVTELRDSATRTKYSSLTASREAFNRETNTNLRTLAESMYCADMDSFQEGLAITESPQWFTTITVLLRGADSVALPEWRCSDFKDGCASLGLLRTFCPVTCGCAEATSALAKKSPYGGCPASCSQRIQRQVADWPCEDLEVAGTANWSAWWTSLRAEVATMVPLASGTDYGAFIQRKIAQGCNETSRDPIGNHSFCDEAAPMLSASGLSSIRGFCPGRCCTGPTLHAECPTACRPP